MTDRSKRNSKKDKTRNMLINVFRTRRSSNESSLNARQLSISVINLATSIGAIRRNSAIPEQNSSTNENFEKKTLFFLGSNGETSKEILDYSNVPGNTSIRDFLRKIFEKRQNSIENFQICLRTAPTLPLSIDQPVKHIFFDDLIATESKFSTVKLRNSTNKEKHEERNSIGSSIFSSNNKSIGKRFSTNFSTLENEEIFTNRTNKTIRSSLFNGTLFGRDSTETSETNLAFVRRKCDEWFVNGLPKLAEFQIPMSESEFVLDKEWQKYLNENSRKSLSESIKLQQEAIYEMLTTELSYIRQISTMTDVFMTSISILKSSDRPSIFSEIEMEKLFSNIQQVIQSNLIFWKEILLPMKIKLEKSGLIMNPSDLKNGFVQFEFYFEPYLTYVLEQKSTGEYFKEKFCRDEVFHFLITWIEGNFTNRLSFSDLAIKPLQRLTRYKLLLEAIQRKSSDEQQRSDLQEMIEKVSIFVNKVNSKLETEEQEKRLRQINDRIGPFENIAAPGELTSILQEFQRENFSNRIDLLKEFPLFVGAFRRQIIQQGPMKMKDAKSNHDVFCFLFTDLFLITKPNKRNVCSPGNSGSNSSAENFSFEKKIFKPPIRIDRLDVREYDRRSTNSTSSAAQEINAASFVGLVYSEYDLLESAFIFQTNSSKQWIENIRTTRNRFQTIIENSRIKFENFEKFQRDGQNETKDFPSFSTVDRPLLISDSFRSVQSSSGVSSTGSFLFTNDDEFSLTTNSEPIPVDVNRTERIFPDKSGSLTRTGFSTVKRRHRSSCPTIQRNDSNEISKSTTINDNESDYDNDQSNEKNVDEQQTSRTFFDFRKQFLINTTRDAT